MNMVISDSEATHFNFLRLLLCSSDHPVWCSPSLHLFLFHFQLWWRTPWCFYIEWKLMWSICTIKSSRVAFWLMKNLSSVLAYEWCWQRSLCSEILQIPFKMNLKFNFLLDYETLLSFNGVFRLFPYYHMYTHIKHIKRINILALFSG